jgi:MerR family transcriptional regulator/heat shock protein HspR
VQSLSQDEGINLAGIRRILELQDELEETRAEVRRLRERADSSAEAGAASGRVFAAGRGGDVFSILRGERPRRRRTGSDLVIYRGPRR